MSKLRKSDIVDADLRDAYELASDGYVVYKSLTIVSTTSGTRTVVVAPSAPQFGLVYDFDAPVEIKDRVRITGTSGSAGDGYFIVESLIDNDSFVVEQFIGDSTGGTAQFMYPAGAYAVGFDSIGLTVTQADNVQDAIYDLATAVEAGGGGGGGGGLTESQHKVLRQLIHFIDEGPAEGFASGAYRETLPFADPFVTQIIWWENSAKLKKIVEKQLTLNGNKTANTISWTIYDTDGVTALAEVEDTINYSGVLETDRTRSISVFGFTDSVITANIHRTLRHLIHFIDEGPAEGFTTGAYRETLPTANAFPTSITWWESSSKVKKIVEKTINRNPNSTTNTVTWQMYDIDGVTVISTVVDAYSYSGILETSRTRSIF